MNAIDDRPHDLDPGLPGVTTIEHDWHGESSLAVSIVEAICRFPNVRPEDVPPLYETVDPDGLEALFAPTQRSGDRPMGRLWFRVGDFGVMVSADGTVIVHHETC